MNTSLFKYLSITLLLTGLQAHEYKSARPDGHAPIMVMGDHTHGQGEFMASYRFMYMDMDGMRSGTDGVSPTDVFAANYTVSPTDMSMQMHMYGFMYAPSDAVTLMAMGSYQDKEMTHTIFPMAAPLLALNDGKSEFTTRAEGFGDLKLSALINLHKGENDRTHATLGVSVPTGSIGKQDIIPGPGGRIDRQLPAPMQLGSGTYDLLAGLTYRKQAETSSYGIQGNAVIRLEDENSHGYQWGDQFQVLGWMSWLVSPDFSLSVSGYAKTEGKMSGAQDNVSLNPPFAPSRRTVTTAFGENYGGDQAGLRFGVNFLGAEAGASGHRFAAEIDIPLYRDLNGFQLETDWIATLGWQKAF
ncbi:MAG: transporter [Verrucomicrobiae bacterium]|nr:transporter [Verrucomicrobiae bacterium]